jgi:nicotinamidase-related amidase
MKSAYLVLDLQNDLVHSDGPNGKGAFGLEAARRDVLGRTAATIRAARKAGALIGFVRTGFSEDFRECPSNSPLFGAIRGYGLLKLGSWGAESHPALPRATGDLEIVKHRVSPFFGTALELVLRAQGIQHVVCSGVSTQAVVQACVRDAHDRDFRVTVLENCCSAQSEEEHRASIEALRMFAVIAASGEVFPSEE